MNKEYFYSITGHGVLRYFDWRPFCYLYGFVVSLVLYIFHGKIHGYPGISPLALNADAAPGVRLVIDLYFPITFIYIIFIAMNFEVKKCSEVISYIESNTSYKRPILGSILLFSAIYYYFICNDSIYGGMLIFNNFDFLVFIMIPFFAYSTAHAVAILFSYFRAVIK